MAAYLAILIIFTISGGLLWLLGLNYDGISGSALSKIHPATYIIVVAFSIRSIASGNPIKTLFFDAKRLPGTAILLISSCLLLLHIIIGVRPMLSTTIDTYILPALLMVFLVDFNEPTLRRLETTIHLIMAVNALLGLFELAIGQRFFPYRFDGDVGYDTRSTALQGHPLVNAIMTGTYLLSLAAGGGRLRGILLLGAILLQCGALVAFGGRTAFVVATLLLAILFLWRIHCTASRRTVPLLAVAGFAFAVPLGLVALGILIERDFFEPIISRFLYDSGSAQTRVLMFDLLAQIPAGQLLMGPEPSLVESIRRMQGLGSGIENPVIRLIVYQGIVATAVILFGLCAFLIDALRRVEASVTVPLIFFLIVILSFESISSKTTLVAKAAVLFLVLHRPRPPLTSRSAPKRRS
ncbi:MAG: VpsF family polysaccharide biosynthesis protein [Salinarimonas sp.]|nr:VpsF family polysaccharide biosynthesis protein [Salinarimonas sp.]